MATTTYDVIANGEKIASKSKKSVAVAAADQARNEQRVDVEVRTNKGTLIYEAKAPKKIKMSPPYTRTVEVPEEVVELINGQRVAYKRPRVGFALLDAAEGAYSIWDLERSEVVPVEIATTRDAGRWFADDAKAYRDANPAPVPA